MRIIKSTRHSKIAGDFGEMLVLYWLSKAGFECARLDHTGIDLIAAKPNQRLGISVKSRTRLPKIENTKVNLYDPHFFKINDGCKFFDCQPYIAVVVDTGIAIQAFLLPTSCAKKYRVRPDAALCWRMSPDFLSRYAADKEIMKFDLKTEDAQWWPEAE